MQEAIRQSAPFRLWCPREQNFTDHSDYRVLSVLPSGIEVLVECSRCAMRQTHILTQLPEGYHVYTARIDGAAGKNPLDGQPVPAISEEFRLIARSPLEAYHKSMFAKELKHFGQVLTFFIDGTPSWELQC